MWWNRVSHCEFDGKSMETEATTWSEIPNGWKAIVEQILVSEEINKSKRAGLWKSQSGIWVGKLSIWVRSFVKNLAEFTGLISSTRIGKPVLMMDVKVSKDKDSSRWVDRENFVYVRWKGSKDYAQRRRRWSIEQAWKFDRNNRFVTTSFLSLIKDRNNNSFPQALLHKTNTNFEDLTCKCLYKLGF